MTTKSRIDMERDFHDRKAEGLVENQDFYRLDITSDIRAEMFRKMGSLEGKKVLDFGCGSGWMSIALAERGCDVVAVDLSFQSLKKAEQAAAENGLESKITFCQMNGEALGFKDSQFDFVIGNAIIHHLDIRSAFQEIWETLKQGGVAYFVEPLGLNPVINLYRKMTPNKRTVDERPLTAEDLRLIRGIFQETHVQYYFFLALLSFFWSFVIKNDTLFLKSLRILKKADRLLLSTAPFLNRYCWLGLFQLQK